MKTLTLAQVVSFALTATLSTQALAQAEFARCQQDRLIPSQAVERVEWYLKNYAAEVQQVVNQLAYPDSYGVDDAIAYYRAMALLDPVKGTPSKRPLYPTFTMNDPPSFTNPQNYRAPGWNYKAANPPTSASGSDRNSPADRPANYVEQILCPACLPLTQQLACQGRQCGAVDDGCGNLYRCGVRNGICPKNFYCDDDLGRCERVDRCIPPALAQGQAATPRIPICQ